MVSRWLPASLSPLAVPRLRRVLLAQIPADLADWLDFVALASLLAFHWNLGPSALAGLTLALALPYVLLGPFVGVLVDRSDQRTLLVASNLLRAVATASFAIAPNLEALLLLVTLKSSVDAVFTPSKQVTLPLLSSLDGLVAANSLSHTINQGTKIIGPALGGVLVTLMDPQGVFIVNAGLSLIAGLALLGLPSGLRHAPEMSEPKSFAREFMLGLTIIKERPMLFAAIASMATGFFLIFLYDGLFALLIREIGYSDSALGLAVAATGAGGVVGALAIGQYATHADPLRLMAVGGIFFGLLVAVVGHLGRGDLTLSPVGFYLVQFWIGFCSAGIFVPYRTLIQRETPPEAIGRVTTVSEAMSALATATAPPLGALLAGWSGVAAPYLLGGYVSAMLALALFIFSWGIRSRGKGPK